MPGSEEHGPGQGPAQGGPGRPVAHDDQPYPRQLGDRPEQVDPLLGGEPPDVPHEQLAAGGKLMPQPRAAPGRVEPLGVHPTAPQPHPLHAVLAQARGAGRGRGEGAVGGVVDAAQPPPRGGLAQRARPVHAGVGGHVGLVDGHRGQVLPAGGGDGGRAEDKGAREVDQLGAVTGQRGVQVPHWQADPEAAVTGQRHGGQPHHRPRERAGAPGSAGRVPGRRGGDDHRLVPAQYQVHGHP